MEVHQLALSLRDGPTLVPLQDLALRQHLLHLHQRFVADFDGGIDNDDDHDGVNYDDVI